MDPARCNGCGAREDPGHERARSEQKSAGQRETGYGAREDQRVGCAGDAFEQEADYVGMYFMERAGYNSTGVADFWRRYAAESPKSVSKRTTHPTSPERFIAIERTHREIAHKKAAGQPLIPNLKQE